MFLAVDVGGTKTQLAMITPDFDIVVTSRFESSSYASLETICHEFLEQHKTKLLGVCVGVAGPVISGQAKLTNLPWNIESQSLKAVFGDIPVGLINDLEAFAWGISTLASSDFVTLQDGKTQSGNQALIAAGTGLGESVLYFDGVGHHPFASEGSHGSFAPPQAQDVDYLNWLFKRYQHVSWERVVSGAFGFRNLFDYYKCAPEFAGDVLLKGSFDDEYLGPSIVGAADAGSFLAQKILAKFCYFYGAEAGNLALKSMAVGGVFIAGGIAPKILKYLQGPSFLHGFCHKGRFRSLLESIPVKIVLNEDCAMRGCVQFLQSVSK
jgi:glucokinase